MKKNNKVNLLDELRQERETVRQECRGSEARLSEHWQYFSDNAPVLIIDSAISGITGWLGFGRKAKKEKETEDTEPAGIMQTAWNGLMAYYPLVWDIVQPLLWQFAVKKVKSIFSGKKKKKKSWFGSDDD